MWGYKLDTNWTPQILDNVLLSRAGDDDHETTWVLLWGLPCFARPKTAIDFDSTNDFAIF